MILIHTSVWESLLQGIFSEAISTEGYLRINGEMGVEWPVVLFFQAWRGFQDVEFLVLKPEQSWTKQNDLVIALVFITVITNYYKLIACNK